MATKLKGAEEDLKTQTENEINELRAQINVDAIKSALTFQLDGVRKYMDATVQTEKSNFGQEIATQISSLKGNFEKDLKKYDDDIPKEIDKQLTITIEDAKADIDKKFADAQKDLRDQTESQISMLRSQINTAQIQTEVTHELTSLISAEVNKQMPEIAKTVPSALNRQFASVFGSGYAASLEKLADAANNFAIDSGVFICGVEKGGAPTSDGKLMDSILFEEPISFHFKFAHPPNILLALNSLEATTASGKYAVWLNAEKISRTQFNIVLKSLMRDVHNCKVHWIAIEGQVADVASKY
jgi:hypothetical protein